ncbi:hypothetical protein [Dactylosporangium darangshiense]|uniref:Uncharacterized protein n=1 Tax=Dactylosporangium darangshiense TaxID=579108 RepID=A0ABP8DUR4_9ACTN
MRPGPLITFLILHGGLRPGYDYLLERKFSSIWREVEGYTVGADLAVFLAAAAQLGFSERVRLANASQIPARLLIQTGRPLNRLTTQDLDDFAAACAEREQRTGKGRRHYEAVLSNTRRVLFHLQILPPPPGRTGAIAFTDRLDAVIPPIRTALVAYLERKRVTCAPKTVPCLATRLTHFGASPTCPHKSTPSTPRPTRSSPSLNAPAASSRWQGSSPTSPSGAGPTPRPDGWCYATTSPNSAESCPATYPSTPTGDSPRNCNGPAPATNWPPARCGCNAPADYASVNSSTWNSTASTKYPNKAHG